MANEKEIKNNGHKYVDLDLPSGTLWTTCNVGASKPSDYGLYFSWGDTQGYTADQIEKEDGKKKFSKDWSDYKFGIKPNFTKYVDNGATLDLEDDAANVHMGGDWHMPTPKQIQELIDNTLCYWTAQDGVIGRLFTSKNDTSKSIFIPAAGNAVDGLIDGLGKYGFVWGNMLNSNHNDSGQELGFISFGANLYTYYSRFNGLSVRGVIG